MSIAQRTAADLVQFEIPGGTGGRLITLESVLRDQIAYVPLEGLVEQAGGSYNALPTRLRVDLGGSTAWLRGGESRVHALSIFSLTQPITEDESGALIAIADVPDFFLKSFRIALRPVGGRSAAASPPQEATPGAAAPVPASLPGETPSLEQLGELATRPNAITAIVIDAGHGGYDTGLQSSDKNTEDAIVLAIATRLKALAEAGSGPSPILTRADDAEMTPQQRAQIVKSVPGSIFISIHAGSSLSPAAEGIAVYYSAADAQGSASPGVSRADNLLTADSRRLAESIGAAAAASAGVALRGVVQAPLKLLSEIQVPAIEIEVGCLTSAADAQRLASGDYLAKLAAGIFNGITAYLGGAAAAPSAAAIGTPEVN